MLHVVTTPAPDFECVVVQRGSDVVICIAERLLSPHAAAVISTALLSLAPVERAGHRADLTVVPTLPERTPQP